MSTEPINTTDNNMLETEMKPEKTRRKKNSPGRAAARILNILGTLILVVVILLCVPITIPRLFQYQIYTVISPSMEPAIPTGSIIYTKDIAPEDVMEGDVIGFYSDSNDGSIITHRVVENQIVSGEFVTKGDANDINDPTTVAYDHLLGRVELSIPYLGQLLAWVATTYGKLSIGCLISLSVVLNIIGSIIGNRTN